MEVKLHDIGEGMTEADISCFLVKPGDRVKADDPLVEVVTDKMTAEIPAPASGIVKEFTVTQGSTVQVGSTLLILETAGAKIVPETDFTGANKKQELEANIEKREMPASQIRILATPYTRKIARELEVDIEKVIGTGPGCRITDEDVHRFVDEQKNHSNTERRETIIPLEKENRFEETSQKWSTGEKPESRDEKENASPQNKIPFRGRRKQIAMKMQHSVFTIPHCTHFEEIDVTNMNELRNQFKMENGNISASAFFIKVLSICLKEFPIFNSRLNEEQEEIELLKEHHIGIAIDAPKGLIVPVIRSVEKKSLKMIHEEMKELTNRALKNELKPIDITAGTFTVSNVGPIGGSIGATPIIQHPQVALVSFHKTKRMPVVVENDEIVIRSIMNMSMSFDHRVVDGATAVRFTNRFSQFINNPKSLLWELV